VESVPYSIWGANYHRILELASLNRTYKNLVHINFSHQPCSDPPLKDLHILFPVSLVSICPTKLKNNHKKQIHYPWEVLQINEGKYITRNDIQTPTRNI